MKELIEQYPRGNKQLRKIFNLFGIKNTIEWFESRGVKLVIQEDRCVFPKSQKSQSIIDCFLFECDRLGIKIQKQHELIKIEKNNDFFLLMFNRLKSKIIVDNVIVTIGGQPKIKGLVFLELLGHRLKFPVPSLFTFNMPKESIKDLMGIVVEKTIVKIQSTKIIAKGPLLITHWGMSGPAILKLSAWGARYLYETNYNFKIQINWLGNSNEQVIINHLKNEIEKHGERLMKNQKIVTIPTRLWFFLLDKLGFNLSKKWKSISKKEFNKLVNILLNDEYLIEGKTTFKEEFVTCGGVDLLDVNFNTMESKKVKGLYFAGEVLDIDGVTGGFNFQAAWSSAYVASKLI